MSSSSSSSPAKTYILKSSEGETFEVEEAVAFQSGMIKNMIEDNCFEPAIPLPNVASKTLAKVLEYCKRHAAAPAAGGEDPVAKVALKEFDADFSKADFPALFDIILAANYLDMRNLVDLMAQTIADSIKDMSPEQVREIFYIISDFTPEEEAELREENKWAFEE